MLVAFGCLSKSNVLVRSSIGPFRSFLYFDMLLTETGSTSERTCQRVVQRRTRGVPLVSKVLSLRWSLLKESEPPPFVGGSLFLYACVAPFTCQRPLGVSAYFNNFLF